MKVKFNRDAIEKLNGAGLSHRVFSNRYGRVDEKSVDILSLKPEYREKIVAFAKSTPENSKLFNGLLQRASALDKVSKKPGTVLIKDMPAFAAAFRVYVEGRCPDRILFSIPEEGGIAMPYLFVKSEYEPPNRQQEISALVRVVLQYHKNGKMRSRTITWDYQEVVTGVTVEGELLKEELTVETDALKHEYGLLMADYQDKVSKDACQFIYDGSEGIPEQEDEWGYRRKVSNPGTSTGTSFKVVCETSQAKAPDSNSVTIMTFEMDEEDEEGDLIGTDAYVAPVHPSVLCYNLETHTTMWLEPWKMTEYEYDAELVNKVFLPKQHKTLLKLLVENPDTLQADVVSGKSGVTFILSAGPPGTGKTMSAEAFAEGTGKILYSIQSDQLGMDPDEIEKNLKRVFNRSMRWGAVLLIDEADLYIRRRGTDMNHSAIIGTFLRTLEYTSGIIFMTSNMQTMGGHIDDAIISRCSAVIQFKVPEGELAVAIFDQFAKLFNMEVGDAVRDEFLAKCKFSGRSIKNVLRLTARMGNLAPDIDDIMTAASFVYNENFG